LAGASLLVLDYRGYGWSTGQPTLSNLLSDTEVVYGSLTSILERAGLENSPCYVMGRSLGSAPAIHLAHAHPDAFRGLILESGFADVPSLLRQLGLSQALIEKTHDEIGNLEKLRELTLSLLVIHGEQDTLLPVQHGEQLYEASAGISKTMLRIPGGGHNTLLAVGKECYFGAIANLIAATRSQ
jgi:pimeloyl-ACP methyl ester carboxylesterase